MRRPSVALGLTASEPAAKKPGTFATSVQELQELKALKDGGVLGSALLEPVEFAAFALRGERIITRRGTDDVEDSPAAVDTCSAVSSWGTGTGLEDAILGVFGRLR